MREFLNINRAVARRLANGITFFLIAVGSHAEESVTVVSWGGSYALASELGYHRPFTEATGIKVKLEDYNGGLAQIRTQVESGSVHWDVVDLESMDEMVGCDEGLFELFDYTTLPPAPDGTPASQDFDAGTERECGVATIYWATVLAYDADNVGKKVPATLEDFFDLTSFPGRRGMRRSPLVNLEWALMADGVPIDQIYETLSTEEGVARAFKKLDSIRDHVVWWEAGAQPPQMLADGEVLITTAYNGRIFNAQVVENQPLRIIWDGQVSDVSFLGIVAGTPNMKNALAFMNFAARAESQAGVGRHIAYSSVRKSGRVMATTHAETGVEMAPHFPAHPNNTKRRLLSDHRFWADRLDELNERFSSWLAR